MIQQFAGRNSLLLLAFFFGLIWLLFFYCSGGSLTWDELLYMNLSLNPEQNPFILNRYFHIYLQRFFFFLFGSSLAGTIGFWSFLISLTITLIIVNSYLLSRSIVHALIAVMFFLSQPALFDFAGVTYVDVTLMTMVLLGVTVYNLYACKVWTSRVLTFVVFGVILFLSVKTKEIGVCLSFLVIGLLFRDEKKFMPGKGLIDICYIFSGMFAGGLILAILDYCYLRDFFFQLRLANIQALFLFNFGEFKRNSNSWLEYANSTFVLLPFLLYMLTLPLEYIGREKPFMIRVLWCLPFVVIFTLTLLLVNGRFHTEPRYFFLVLPLLCIWAPQIFCQDLFNNNYIKSKTYSVQQNAIIVSIGIYLMYLLGCWIVSRNTLSSGWSFLTTYSVVIAPLSLGGMMILIAMWSKQKGVQVAVICILLTLLAVPVGRNVKRLVTHQAQSQSNYRFTPYREFENVLQTVSPEQAVFVSKRIYDDYKMLGRGVLSCYWMFNVYFDKSMPENSFSYSANFMKAIGDRVNVILVTKTEIQTYLDTYSNVMNLYRIIPDKSNTIMLLQLLPRL